MQGPILGDPLIRGRKSGSSAQLGQVLRQQRFAGDVGDNSSQVTKAAILQQSWPLCALITDSYKFHLILRISGV